MFNSNNMTVDEKIAELRKKLLEEEPPFQISPEGHLLTRCDNCHATVDRRHGVR